MALNKAKGNMYPWVTHTWNPIKGACPHRCFYCYMKQIPTGDLRLVDKEMRSRLYRKNENLIIFIGSSTDMFSDAVPSHWIAMVLEKCKEVPENTYLFQTKNPARFLDFTYPPNTILGTTIESDVDLKISSAPPPEQRANDILRAKTELGLPIMISIEPILSFFPYEFCFLIERLEPKFVSIGADSKRSDLPEPSKDQITELIGTLETFTEVKIKPNLQRLL